MSDHPYDEQTKYYEARECEYQDRIEELEAENKRLREQLDEQNEVIKDLDNALAAVEEKDDAD